jgi:hypothetical protein
VALGETTIMPMASAQKNTDIDSGSFIIIRSPACIPGTGRQKGHRVIKYFEVGSAEGGPDISGLLAAWNNGDEEALSHLSLASTRSCGESPGSTSDAATPAKPWSLPP